MKRVRLLDIFFCIFYFILCSILFSFWPIESNIVNTIIYLSLLLIAALYVITRIVLDSHYQVLLAYDYMMSIYSNKKDENGKFYVLRFIRICRQCSTNTEKVVALLSKILEHDESVSLKKLSKDFGNRIIYSLYLLNKTDDETYGRGYVEYLDRIRTDNVARKIKLLDLEQNLNISEYSTMTEKEKYSIQFLKDEISKDRMLEIVECNNF